MAQIVGEDFLKEFLAHEIKELSRIRQQLNLVEHIPAIDNVAIALVPVKGADPKKVAEPLSKVLRDSDVIIPKENFILLMLPGTDEMGAIHVLEGVSDFLSEVFKFVYAIYPQDGTTAEDLIEVLKERAKRQLGLEI